MFNEACELADDSNVYGLGATGTVTSPNGTTVEATLQGNCAANYSGLCSRPTLMARCQSAGYPTPSCAGGGGGGGGGQQNPCAPGTVLNLQGVCVPAPGPGPGTTPNPGTYTATPINPGGAIYQCPDGTYAQSPSACPAPASQTTTTATTTTSSAGIPSTLLGVPTLYWVLGLGAFLLLKKR